MATAPLTMADYLRMANTVGEQPGLGYDEYAKLAGVGGAGPVGVTGATSVNPGAATGSAYASPDRYKQYQAALRTFQNNAYANSGHTVPGETTGWGENANQQPDSWVQDTPLGDPYQQFLDSLTPSQQAEYDKVVNSHYSKDTSTAKGAVMVAMAAMGGAGFLASLPEAGAAEAAATGFGTDAVGGGTGLAGTSSGFTGLGGATAAAEGAGGATAAELAAANAADVAGGMVPEFGTNAAYDAAMTAAAGAPGYDAAMQSVIKGLGTAAPASTVQKIIDQLRNTGAPTGTGTGAGTGTDWTKLLGGAALGAGALSALDMSKVQQPGLPDFKTLAEQTAASQQKATDAQTQANRPNQTNAQGDTLTWVQDPATGAWTQKVAYGAANQAKTDQTNSMLSALRGNFQTSIGQPLAAPAMKELQPSAYQPMGKLFGG